jgi:hypothetical protein
MNLLLGMNFDLMYFSGMKVDRLLDDQFNWLLIEMLFSTFFPFLNKLAIMIANAMETMGIPTSQMKIIS